MICIDGLDFATSGEFMNNITFTGKIKCFHVADENLSNFVFVVGAGNCTARLKKLLNPAHVLRVEYNRVDEALSNGQTILVILPDGIKKFRYGR